MTAPAPSPGTNPWRRASKGRLAWVGASANDCHTSAFISAQPCRPTGSNSCVAAETTTVSTRPARRRSIAQRSAALPLAQALPTM